VTKHFKKHKEEARKIITESAHKFGLAYGVNLKRISIRNQKTRWGSCSKLGNLNFNYKIIFLPKELQDYIIVHEICHLIEFNHSKRFWNEVSRTFPNYRELRKELRKIKTSKL